MAARKRRMRRTWWREAARTYAKIKNHATINQWEWKGNEDEATRTHAKNKRSHNKPLGKAMRTREERGKENKNEATATL